MLRPQSGARRRKIVFSVLLLAQVGCLPLLAGRVKLYDPQPVHSDEFGTAVAADAGVAVVGIPLADGPTDSGAILIFDSTAGPGWPASGPFKAPTPSPNERFGANVAYRDGDIFVSGAGQVYHLVRDPVLTGNWIHAAALLPPVASSTFGNDLAIDGDTLVVGDFTGYVTPTQPCGLAHVFHFEGGAFVHQATLGTASDCPSGPGGDAFGISVAISGDTIAVGTLQGKVHLFHRVAGVWQHEAKIDPAPEAGDDLTEFGRAVAVDGERLLAGSGKLTTSPDPGNRAYIYERQSLGNWQRAAVLIADVATPILFHGYSVALRGDRAIVGSTKSDFNAIGFPGNTGATYHFERQADGSWPQTRRDVGVDGAAFGGDLDFDGDRLWVGDRWATINFNCCFGAAYTIDLGPVFTDGFEGGTTAGWSATVP